MQTAGGAPVSSIALDRSSAVPLYLQVAHQIRAAITSGALAPGSRLDAEVDLARSLDLSRPTVRRAIAELVDQGLLVRKRGVGTQVVHGQVDRSLGLTSLHDDLADSHQAPRTQVLEHDVVAVDETLAAALGVPVGSAVLRLHRLRLAQDEPLALMANWVPGDVTTLTPDALEERGLYALLRERGVSIRVGRQRIGARRGTAPECRLLQEPSGAALLTMERTTYDDVGRTVEVGRHLYRASRYAFTTTLVER